jgi:hypothetical protein
MEGHGILVEEELRSVAIDQSNLHAPEPSYFDPQRAPY